MNEDTKQQWFRVGIIALITFIVAYLAFFAALKHHLKKMNNPYYQVEKIAKELAREQKDFEKLDEKYVLNPFEPKMRPMFVNLVKEPSEYKIIVDLATLEGNEDAINVKVNGAELTVTGEMDKKIRGREKIISFAQTYYLDQILEESQIRKEKRGDKYIITVPFKTDANVNNVE